MCLKIVAPDSVAEESNVALELTGVAVEFAVRVAVGALVVGTVGDSVGGGLSMQTIAISGSCCLSALLELLRSDEVIRKAAILSIALRTQYPVQQGT